MIRACFLLAPMFILLAACSQAPAPTVSAQPTARSEAAPVLGPNDYMVKRGDTLYRIAREQKVDLQDIVALNKIDNPALLREGQVLRLRETAPAGAPAVMPVGIASAVEARPLGEPGAAPAAPRPAAAHAGSGILREPRGGKEPYSDEAMARLNKPAANGTATATGSAPAVAPAAISAPAPVVPPVIAPAAVTPAEKPATTADKTSPPAGDVAEVEGVAWSWPTSARLAGAYSEAGNKGFDFPGKTGDPVHAAADGRALYVGDALAGYGKLIILKHSSDHLSVYAHNSKVLVKEGQNVKRGQKIAEFGNSGSDSVKLHFEVRKQGKPVDPSRFLPKR